MIRTIAFGVLCLAGLGVVAVAKIAPAKVSQARPADTTQVSAGGKSDRLPLNKVPANDAAPAIAKVDAVYVAPADDRLESLDEPKQSRPMSSPQAKFISRHWHDPYDTQAKRLTRTSADGKLPRQMR
ncbi:hypothetical protein [Bradyrhizobium canariense]|nr:hypothetical protein [Bradyrhizobium canariense]